MVKTFDEWFSSLPLTTRRTLYEEYWIKNLCREAWDEGLKSAKAESKVDYEAWHNQNQEYCYICSNKNCDNPNGKH